jgi:hypothetical protein
MQSCASSELCKAIFAGPILMEIDDNNWCVDEPVYAGCSLNFSCAAVLSYGCIAGDPATPHQFSTSCLPELGWEPCDPPEPNPPLCP